MLAVSTRLPDRDRGRSPLILVHGAANSAAVWTYWLDALAADGWPVHAIGLRGHGASAPVDLSTTSMADYLADVCLLAGQLRERPVVVGWSMGGLVAMMAAGAGLARACVGLAPSTPARAVDERVALRTARALRRPAPAGRPPRRGGRLALGAGPEPPRPRHDDPGRPRLADEQRRMKRDEG